MHHVLCAHSSTLTRLSLRPPGSDEYGWSKELHFTVPGATTQLPVRIGIMGDLGGWGCAALRLHTVPRRAAVFGILEAQLRAHVLPAGCMTAWLMHAPCCYC